VAFASVDDSSYILNFEDTSCLRDEETTEYRIIREIIPDAGTASSLFIAMSKYMLINYKKPRYRKDNRAMRPIYERPENCM